MFLAEANSSILLLQKSSQNIVSVIINMFKEHIKIERCNQNFT